MPTDRACRQLLAVIATLDPEPIPIERLAELADYSPRHAWRIVNRLEESGQITRHADGFRKPFQYQITGEALQ